MPSSVARLSLAYAAIFRQIQTIKAPYSLVNKQPNSYLSRILLSISWNMAPCSCDFIHKSRNMIPELRISPKNGFYIMALFLVFLYSKFHTYIGCLVYKLGSCHSHTLGLHLIFTSNSEFKWILKFSLSHHYFYCSKVSLEFLCSFLKFLMFSFLLQRLTAH